jgi:threonine dehydratase
MVLRDPHQTRNCSSDDNESENERKDVAKAVSSYVSLIGNTPLIKLPKLSKILNRNVMVKMECMNPGGTGKDRAAKYMVEASYESLSARKYAVEGTSVRKEIEPQY